MIENNKLNNTKHTAVIPTQVGIWNVESKKPFLSNKFLLQNDWSGSFKRHLCSNLNPVPMRLSD